MTPRCSSTRTPGHGSPRRQYRSTSARPASPGRASRPTRASAPECSGSATRTAGRRSREGTQFHGWWIVRRYLVLPTIHHHPEAKPSQHTPRSGGPVKAVRIHKFHETPVIDEVPEPKITGPLDVIVKIGGAGVCRTDLHIIEGQWDAAMGTPLPYILGHENAGWVHEVGSAVTNVAVGDTVILHPTPTCGLCHACRAGDDMHCENSKLPRPVHGRRHGRVPADLRPRLREARPRDAAEGRGGPRRRRHHRLPRGPQGAPAAVPGHHRRGHRRRAASATSASSAWPRCQRDEHRRRRPQPRRAQARRAARRGRTRSSPTASTSTR